MCIDRPQRPRRVVLPERVELQLREEVEVAEAAALLLPPPIATITHKG